MTVSPMATVCPSALGEGGQESSEEARDGASARHRQHGQPRDCRNPLRSCPLLSPASSLCSLPPRPCPVLYPLLPIPPVVPCYSLSAPCESSPITSGRATGTHTTTLATAHLPSGSRRACDSRGAVCRGAVCRGFRRHARKSLFSSISC